MKRFIVILIFAYFTTVTVKAADSLDIYTVNQLQDSMKVNSKPVIIYYYADWCKYCKVMEKRTLADSKVIDSLNTNYYLVKFDGESRDSVTFLGRTYKFIPTGNGEGYHEFNYVFAKVTGYPSFVFLSNHYETMNVKLGYLNTEEFLKLLSNQ